MGVGLANERRCYIYIETPPLIGWAHTQNDPFGRKEITFFHNDKNI